jgi:acyl-CoA thioesterase-1
LLALDHRRRPDPEPRKSPSPMTVRRLLSASPFRAAAAVVVAAAVAAALAAPLPSRAETPAAPIRILAFGDSLMAGYGLPPKDGFVARLEKALAARGHHVNVINASVAGDTAEQGLERLEWSTPADIDAVMVELGANDALRGLDPRRTREALDAVVGAFRAKGLPVLVAGMLAPRNLGAAYATAFEPIFKDVAAKHDALFYPFFLDGVAGDRGLNQGDGIHPNAAGVDIIVERLLPTVEQLVAAAKAGKS